MSFELLINGVDYTDQFERTSLTINEALQVRGFTMSVTVFTFEQDVSKPLAGQEIIFKKDSVKEFAGRISTVEEAQASGPYAMAYQLQCIDYTVDLDSELLEPDKIPAQSAGDMVRSIVGRVGKGFTSNNVLDGSSVTELELNYDTVSAIIQRLADVIEYTWYVDYDRDVNFFYLIDRVAPLSSINLDTDAITYRNAVITESWDQVKNRLVLTGAKAKSSNQFTQTFTGDGGITFFPLGYEPWSTESSDITLTVDSVPQTILLDSVAGFAGDGTGNSGEAFLCIDNWGVRFPESHAPGSGGDVPVEISYNYAYEPVVVVEDSESILTMRERENTATAPSNGVHEFKFDIPDLRVETELSIIEYGQLLLARYANIVYYLTFESDIQGWKPGQNFNLISAANRRDQDRTMYITGVVKTIYRTDPAEFTYQISASSSPFPD